MIKHMKMAPPLMLLALLGAAQAAVAADQAQMMTICNTYAARHLRVSPSDITELNFIGKMSDGKTYGVVGSTVEGQAFQCIFDRKGKHVVKWNHSAPTTCPDDVSEADRYLYPACG